MILEFFAIFQLFAFYLGKVDVFVFFVKFFLKVFCGVLVVGIWKLGVIFGK